MNVINRLLLLALSSLCFSCSSGDKSVPPIVEQLNLKLNENESFNELIMPIGGNGLLRIVRISGSDSTIATITGNTVSINRSFDYERPSDSNRDNLYLFEIQASDGSNQIVNKVSLSIQDVLEPAVTVPATRSYRENGTSVVAVVLTTDLKNPSYTLSGSDSSLFSISNSGEISFVSPPDYEDPIGSKGNVYEIEVTVSEGEFEEVRSISITVEDVSDNFGPTITNPGSLNVPENTVTPITTLVAVDPEGDNFTFSLNGLASDNQYFEITSDGSLSFNSKQDYENCADQNTDCTYEVVVLATDVHGMAGSSERIFVVVTDVAVGYFAPPGMEELKSIVCSDASCDNYRDAEATVIFLEGNEVHARNVTHTFRRSTVVELADDEGPYRLYRYATITANSIQRQIVSDLLSLGYTSESDLIFSVSLSLSDYSILAESFPNSIFVYAAGNDSASSVLVDGDGNDIRIEVAEDGTRRYFAFDDEGVEYEIDENYGKFYSFNFYFEMREQDRFLVVGGSNEQVGKNAGYDGGLHRVSNSNGHAEDNFIAAPFFTKHEDNRTFSGTSTSVPQVTSAMATIKHVYPSLSAKNIMQLVLELAVPKPNDREDRRDIPDPGVLDLTGLVKDSGEILTLEEIRALIADMI